VGSENKREQLWARIYLAPIMQAEIDRDVVRRTRAMVIEEAGIMKDVQGWHVGESVYSTKRYVPPSVRIATE
jgi:NADH dehydrogenase (ubiquinone) 1 alpha subcomplex subunit 13